ncbi:MAG TPA: NAD(+) diphosphatase [Dehalococcoidia bacterium]|nr:NAD(+) diphosphatase [Dehalococcoidia bacterium]
MTTPHTFAGNPLDRLAVERRDPDWISGRLEDPESRVLALWRLQIPLREGDPATLAWGRTDLLQHISDGSEPVLLGMHDGIAHFAIDISGLEDGAEALSHIENAAYVDARAAATQVSITDAGMLAQAKAQIDWHARHGFCPKCGGKTSMHEGGLMRQCGQCEAQHFPRTDPVVIVVVSDGDRCLLGRQKVWPLGMFSALAGFVDQGETIEEAVRREVMEEAGIALSEVSYHSSQPWPFPSSLMIGCLAKAATTEITIDEHELDDAQWFTREQARDSLVDPESHPELRMPGEMAIAHQLVKAWVALPD